jgi:hypothetical protein
MKRGVIDSLNVVDRDCVMSSLEKLKKEQEEKVIALNQQKEAAKAA